MKQNYFFLSVLSVLFYTTTFSQVGIGTDTPHTSAILDIESKEKGLLPPRMTTSEKNAIRSPAEGLVVYDTELKCLSIYVNDAWEWECATTNTSSSGANLINVAGSTAQGCYRLLLQDSKLKDGIYNVEVGSKNFNTYCDMANGGLTLIWSYSAKTAKEEYDLKAYGLVQGAQYRFDQNTPFNFPTAATDTASFPFENFRVPGDVMRFIGYTNHAIMKVRLTETPFGYDQMGKDNFAILNEPFETALGAAYASALSLWKQSYGRLEGIDYFMGSYTYGGSINSEANKEFYWYQGSIYPLHIFFASPIGSQPSNFRAFGWYGTSFTNKHLFNCPTTALCSYANATLHPTERYIQWFIK